MLLELDEARARVLRAVAPLGAETLDLVRATGRVLAESVVAGSDLPRFDNSAMDGYAVRAADTLAASPAQPVRLTLTGATAAGDAPSPTVLGPGEARRIFTGAPLPPGADTVVAQERADVSPDGVDVSAAHPMGTHVRRAGEDVQAGSTLLTPGTILGPAELALLAAQGHSWVRVHRRPRVAIVPTGDEIAEIDHALAPGKILNSNSIQLAAQVQLAGGIPVRLPPVADDAQALQAALADAAACSDVVVTTGGVSVGDHDLVRQVVTSMGTLLFWRVAIKPGKPVAFGLVGGRPIFGLPGNPVSTFVCFELFVRPALRRLAGHAQVVPMLSRARLDHALMPDTKRLELVRCRLARREGEMCALPLEKQGSGQLSSIVGAHALALIPPGNVELAAGAIVDILPLRDQRDELFC
ncbi:MAG: gephyrin-like molybdotransferase Glp [Myxococcota bacterium]